MANITVNIRPSTGQVFQVQVETEGTTVEQLKQIIAEKMGNVDASSLKLVFSGRILKNEDLVTDSKIVAGCTIHVVRSGVNKAPSTSASQSSKSETTNTTQQPAESIPPIPPTPSPSNLTGLGSASPGASASPFGGMQMPNIDPEVMRQMMDSPFMQNMMNNTDFVRSIIMSNPQMKALVEQNPELGHVISDPAFLRQSMEMMRNPELMREMQRNNDRALSNIEAIPGGFNHLRRMYNTFQSPLESAMSPGSQGNTSDEANNQRLARELNVQSVPENSLNTQALPNPWAPATNNNSSSTPASTTPTSTTNNSSQPPNPFAALGGANQSENPFGANPFAALFGGGQPQQQQQTQQQQTPFWADPNFIQASLRMQQALMSSQNNNNNNTNNPQQQQPQSNLFQQLMMGFPPGGYGQQQQPPQQPAIPTEPPEVRFRDQLAQLEEIGFDNKPLNIRALLATGGNVEAAINFILEN